MEALMRGLEEAQNGKGRLNPQPESREVSQGQGADLSGSIGGGADLSGSIGGGSGEATIPTGP